MIKKYQRKIAILLIALLVFPMNIFSSIGAVLAQDGEEESYSIVYETDFSEEGHNVRTDAGGTGSVTAVEIEGETYDAFFMSEREDGWNSPTLTYADAKIELDKTYRVTAEFYTDSAEVDGGIFQIADNTYGVIGGGSAQSDILLNEVVSITWEGEITGGDHIRFQTGGADELQYYLLSIKIEELVTDEESGEPGDEEPEEPEVPFEHEVIYEHDFEDGDTNGWYGRGPADVTVTDDGSGENSALLVSGRTVGWHGPGIDLTSSLEHGAQYEMEVSVKRVTAEDTSTLISTVAEQPEHWERVIAEDVNDTEWTVLNGTYTFEHDVTFAEFYVESSDETEEFYIDDVVITQLTPGTEPEEGEDPEDIPEDERVAIFTDFEDGTTQGWEPRGDNEELSIADIGANDSSHSLLVENRLASSDAAIIEFLESMHPGHEYAISLYVRLAEGEADTELQLSAAQTIDGDTSYYPPIIAPETVTSGEWVKLEGTYAVPRDIEALSFYVEEVYDEDSTSGVSYYIDDFLAEVTVSDNPVQTDLTPLKDIYDGEFYIGNALEAHLFNGRTGELLRHHHNLVTAENVMKPENYYVDGEFNPNRPNQWLQNAVDNNMLVHGHVLMWHSQSEDSLYQDADGNPLSAEVALANMREHIENVMRSADEVAGDNIISWDVVNEALDGDWSNPEEWEGILRPASGWLQAIGPDYMYEAFLAARQVADELGRHDMVLYYNDYNDHVQAKARTMYHMVKDINERYAEEFPEDDRLLIGGVGMQAHYSTSVNIENIRESLERFITLGVEVGVTELDVGASETTTLTERENLEQAYFYAQLFDLYREHSDHINRVTFWGLSDNNSWRSENNPLLFDRNLQAKTAYYAVADPATYLAENEDPGVVVARQGNAAFGTPVMEGEIDGIWEFAPVLPINRFQTAHNGATGEARVLWDNENIYVLVEVNDTELDKSGSDAHEQDSVEVFIDEQNTKAASYGEGHGQFRVNFDNEQSFNPGPVEGFESRTFVDGTDYVVEMKIPFSTTTLEAGDMIGFDVQINDAFDGNRNSVAIWSDFNSGMGWSDPSVFGELTLDPVSPEYLQSIIDDLNERIDNLEGSNADLVQEVQELEEALQDALAGNEELRDLINSLLARLEALENRVDELEGEDGDTTPGDDDEATPGDDDPEDPEGTDDSEDETDSDDDSEATEDSETADGETLPKTATSIYNFLLIGALILIAGAGLALYSYKRRRA